MNTQGKSALAISIAAALGAAPGAADAAVYTATLTQVLTYSNNGTAGTAGNVSSSTATWTYNDVTGLLTETTGTFNNRVTTSPTSTLYRTVITGLVVGAGGAATATTFACQEGNFGGNVGASICGNYTLGANFTSDSTTTWGPGTAATRTLGGDDAAAGAQQTIASLDGMQATTFDPPPGTDTLVLTNKTCTGPCATLPVGAYNGGQQWTLGSLVLVPTGPVDDVAQAEAGQPIDIDVLANDTGYTDPVTVTLDVAPGAGGTALVVGSPGSASGIKITYTSDPGFTGVEQFTYRADDGSQNATAGVNVTVEDTVPDAITFATQSPVALSTLTTSADATISGISTAVPISVTNGEYSIDGGAFTTTAGTVNNNQLVTVRHTSAATPATDTVTTLTVGGFSTVDGTFTSTTVPADTIPDAFSFPAQADVALSTPITSAAATITGINTPAAVTVSGGDYSVGCTGTFTSAAGTISDGETVCVRVTSSGSALTATTATLTVGGVAEDFTVTTAAVQPDTKPDQFTFTDQTNVDKDTVIVSNAVTIAGINAAAPISVTGGEYSIGCNGSFTSADGTISNGETVCVRHTSASTSGTAVNTTLNIGPANPPPPGAATRTSDTFSSSTRRSGGSSAADGLILGVLGLLGLAGRRRKSSR